MSVDEPSELESVAETRAVEGPALSVDEPSKQSRSVRLRSLRKGS